MKEAILPGLVLRREEIGSPVLQRLISLISEFPCPQTLSYHEPFQSDQHKSPDIHQAVNVLTWCLQASWASTDPKYLTPAPEAAIFHLQLRDLWSFFKLSHQQATYVLNCSAKMRLVDVPVMVMRPPIVAA